MLWPYVRQAGDCLTDDEIRAGQKGVYNGPVNTNPDMSNVKVETPPATSITSETKGLFSRLTGGRRNTTASVQRTSVQSTSVQSPSVQSPSGPSMNGPGFSTPPPQRAADGPCVKGWLWPFVRKPGECLTGTERENGQTGVYRAEQVVASAAPAAGPGVTPISAPGRVGAETPAGGVETPPVSAEPQCRKGWLWPFVRKAGDCPTVADRGRLI
jgi:hypothetical protein